MKTENPLARALRLVLFLPILCQPALGADLPDAVVQAKNSIEGEMIVSHIDFLASEYCRGRETGKYGMEVASKYISTVLRGAGLEPAGDYGGYGQSVRLNTVELSPDIHLRVEEAADGAAPVRAAKLEWDFLPVILSAEKAVSAPLVFAGYGITAPEHDHDDYKGLNAEGKISVVMRHEPGEKDPESPFEGRKLSDHGTLLSKIRNAQDHGAVGILFVTDPLNHTELTPSATDGTYWPSLRKEQLKDDEDFEFLRFNPRMRLVGDDYGVSIPVLSIDGKFADYLLGERAPLESIQREIDGGAGPRSFPIADKTVSMAVSFKKGRVDADNLVAKVTGSDPDLKDEVVLVGAHYDHVGKDNRGRVFGGADDNASGTAGVLELARAFSNLAEKPKRSVVFIFFTAEEKGLLGSRYYVENPLFPLEDTVAMINLDMIGRNDVDQVSLLGRYQYPALYEVIDQANRDSVNFEINFSVEEYVRQSDHFPFMREGVPALFFNSGMHDQLHRPEDTVSRIKTDKTERIARLTFVALWQIADSPEGTDFREAGEKP
jgi:hypothetical protein